MTIEFRDGTAVIDGTPRLLVTADYPYYRDDPAVWTDRLRTLRDHLNVTVVTAYLPWRHHQPDPDGPPDFTGRRGPSRDVVGFLHRCADLGLGVVCKPGPFIHAETNYGGLPDWVRPLPANGIEAVLDANDRPAVWSGSCRTPHGAAEQWALPAPLGALFRTHATRWLAAVGEQVIRPHRHPRGPVLLAQIANEGLYTNGAQPLWAYDYSASALEFFRCQVRNRYGDIATYNRVHATTHRTWTEVGPPRAWRAPIRPEDLRRYVDWGEFHAGYLAEVYRLWTEALSPGVPVVVNLNPPAGEPGALDAWLSRVRPELWQGIQYGFTNWMGVVSADPAAHARYVVAAKRAPGPNLEENWGFADLYDRAYADAATSFHQSLLALAVGATGFNVYTGVATAGWFDDLDALHTAPYPDSAPIGAGGEPGPKAAVVRMLADFCTEHGAEFLACEPVLDEAWAIYPPYASVAAWAPPGGPDAPPRGAALPAVPPHGAALRAFHDRMRADGSDYRLVDLTTVTATQLGRYPAVTFHSAEYLDRTCQQTLADYIRAGGHLRLHGPTPRLDADLRPCTVLADALGAAAAVDRAPPTRATRLLAGSADVYLRTHPTHDTCYLVILLAAANGGQPVRVAVDDGRRRHMVDVVAADGGAALLRIAHGRLDSVLVTGLNGHLGSAVRASCTVDGEIVAAPVIGDLARIRSVMRATSTDHQGVLTPLFRA